MEQIYLSSPDPPAVVARGLYAGLKGRNGMHTALPVRLRSDTYVNAGFIDGLSAHLMRSLQLTEVKLRIIGKGTLLLQWYCLNNSGSIHHYADEPVSSPNPIVSKLQDIKVPEVLLKDRNIAFVFFKISHESEVDSSDYSILHDWCFYADHNKPEHQKVLLQVSRSNGESINVIEQHYKHQKHLLKLYERFSDLHLLPMPHLHIYESDAKAFELSKQLVEDTKRECPSLEDTVNLYHNPLNLGGGGNMSLAVLRSIVSENHDGDFVMLDSDTLVPFKTLYTSCLISALSNNSDDSSSVISPVVAYRNHPTTVLEAGALFGRGAWDQVSDKAVMPCIWTFEHGASLSDKHVHSRLAQPQESTYPPFIYSLYRLGRENSSNKILPAPFFLRGDDIEYGLHLKRMGIKTVATGSLLVFQEPKHSPWHEVMAILHSIIILLAYSESQDLIAIGEKLAQFFEDRLVAHYSYRDLQGISIYQRVLVRLLSLLDIPERELHSYFYDPKYYQDLQEINSSYTKLNYKMSQSMIKNMPEGVYREQQFLYYEPLPRNGRLPDDLVLLNNLNKTASILHPTEVSTAEMQNLSFGYKQDLRNFIQNLEILHLVSMKLLDREIIEKHLSHSINSIELSYSSQSKK